MTQDALVEGVHFRFDLARLARARLPRGGGQHQRPRRLGRRAARAHRLARAAAETRSTDVIELYEGMRSAACRCAAATRRAPSVVVLTVTALGRADRVPGPSRRAAGRPRRRDRAARRRPAPRSATGRLAAAADPHGGGVAARARRDRDARHLRRARRPTRRTSRSAPAAARDRARARAARRRRDDRRSRLRRGLRAARGDAGPARLHGDRPLRGGLRRRADAGRRAVDSAAGSTSASHCSKCARGRAPDDRSRAASPPAKRITVGIERTS